MEEEGELSVTDARLKAIEHKFAIIHVGNISFKLSRNIANPN
jgi:hypothetical protein